MISTTRPCLHTTHLTTHLSLSEDPTSTSYPPSSYNGEKAAARARSALDGSIKVKTALRDGGFAPLLTVSRVMADAIRNGGKLLFCGNGGSAADCQHIATEFVVRLTSKRNRSALPALAFTTDTSTLTAAGNDYGFDKIFARQVEALGSAGDALIGISTGGTSKNIIAAFKTARSAGIVTIGFLGSHLETMAPLLDYIISIPSDQTNRIQEAHITLGHILVDLVECDLFGYPTGE
jgi:D-sedoheptulose 7-phosphate isomerase